MPVNMVNILGLLDFKNYLDVLDFTKKKDKFVYVSIYKYLL